MSKVRFSWPLRIIAIFLSFSFIAGACFLIFYNLNRRVVVRIAVTNPEMLSQVNVNLSNKPVDFLGDFKIEALVDTAKYNIEIKTAPFPKKLFLGELRIGAVITGWYQIIFGLKSRSNPYIGHTRIDLDALPIEDLPKKICALIPGVICSGIFHFNQGKQIKPVLRALFVGAEGEN